MEPSGIEPLTPCMPCNKLHPLRPLIATGKAIAVQSIYGKAAVKWMSLDASVLRFFALGFALRPTCG